MKEKLRQFLSQRQKRHIVDPSRTPAAVLLPIYYRQGQYYILFIKRTNKVAQHKGQISFPGGVYEEKDGTLVTTALRECAEEIDLPADDVEILGELDDEASVSTNYIITTFVASIPWPHQLKVDGEETEEIIEIPISALLDSSCWHHETQDEEKVTSYSYHYQGRVIWGATARILNNFLNIFTQVTHDR